MLTNPWKVMMNLGASSIHDYRQAGDFSFFPVRQCDIQ